MHVESFDEVLSDAGSTPAASTTYLVLYTPLLGRRVSRLQLVSKLQYGIRLIEEPNCIRDSRRTQVHVALCRREILMSGHLLDRTRQCTAHREVSAERSTQDVDQASLHKALAPDRAGMILIREAPPDPLGFLLRSHRSHRSHLSESVYDTGRIPSKIR